MAMPSHGWKKSAMNNITGNDARVHSFRGSSTCAKLPPFNSNHLASGKPKSLIATLA
jgi:hypothetical protein